jgi:hypothetical protein
MIGSLKEPRRYWAMQLLRADVDLNASPVLDPAPGG